MKTVTDHAHAFDETDDCWIELRDGCRLAARRWLPHAAARDPVPCIVEILPYRKRDAYAVRDATLHRYFAGHGYAALRVDMRGSGDSDGRHGVFAFDAEQEDTLDVLAWIARQPWCDGQVGMIGVSWGGLQGIQAASRRPAALKAVVAVAFANDHYRFGQVFHGGCLPLRATRWSAQVFGYKSRPPDPQLVGDRWRTLWHERLADDTPQIVAALRHPLRDDFWERRAAAFADIRCPVLVAGGWADVAYVGAVGVALAEMQGPRIGILGPWGHNYPHLGTPGPAIGFLQEAVRWFDRWMRGAESPPAPEPMLRAWLSRGLPARPFYPRVEGRWVEEARWPSPHIVRWRFPLRSRSVLGAGVPVDAEPMAEPLAEPVAGAVTGATPAATAAADRTDRVRAHRASEEPTATYDWLELRSPQSTGLQAGELMPWFQHGPAPELPGDQREDDGKSLCFDTEPLETDLDVLGGCVARLTLSVDRPTAFLCVRLCDVAPDGASSRVALGMLNLTHRDDHARCEALVPGQLLDVRVPLVDCGHTFARGHRLRVAVSTCYWPLIWPSPEPVTLRLAAGRGAIDLPVRPPSSHEASAPEARAAEAPRAEATVADADVGDLGPFEPPEAAAPRARTVLRAGGRTRRTIIDDASMQYTIEITDTAGRVRYDDIGLEVEALSTERYTLRGDDPLSATADIAWTWWFHRPGWSVRTEAVQHVACDREAFHVDWRLRAYEHDTLVHDSGARESIPRRGL